MKQFLLVFSLFTGVFGIAQDTITVQTFTYDSISTRRAIFDFPASLQGESFEKVLMYYNIKCDPLTPWDSYNCGEWDYLAHAKIHVHTGVMDSNKVEGPHYLLNDEWTASVDYVNNPYYHYFENYQSFINYSSQSDNDYSIGLGTSSASYPFGSSNTNQRTQILWTATEIAAAGITAGNIDKLRFNIGTLGQSLGNLKINMKHSTATFLEGFDEMGWTNVYHMNTNFSGTGLATINLTYPFVYDGTSDILMDISFENGSAGSDNVVSATQTLSNSVVYSNEKLGYLKIPQNEHVELEITDYDFQDQITVSFWANGDAGILPVNTSVIEAADSLNNRILNVHFPWSNSENYWDAGEGSGYDRINKAATAGEIGGEWHHWAFTKNSTSGVMNIYKDGVLWHTGSGLTRDVGIVNTFKLGANRNQGNGWPGKVDEFRVWDTELAASEILTWMNQKVTAAHPNYADLVVYYNFDGSASVIDQSPNGFDGMMSESGMVQFYNESQAGFVLSDIRPDITFVQGTYTSSLDSTLVMDSVMVDPISIAEYQVSGKKFIMTSLDHHYPAGYSYTYDWQGNKIDSTLYAADMSIANDSIFYYEEAYEIIDPFEIGRFITPYGIGFDLGPNGFTYVYDVTDYQQLLMGQVDFAAHNTQELIDVQFRFIKGTPPRDIISVEKIWGNHGSHTYADLDNDVKLPSMTLNLDPTASQFKIRTRITGHGHHGSINCCEWGNGQGRDHELLIDGVPRFTWEIWQETECGDNPNTGQGGTWPYAREGWCPGDMVKDHEFEITPYVTGGTSVAIDYDIEDVPSNDQDQGNGNYNMAMHLMSYGAPNFTTDAAIVDVLNPNNWEYYSKFNPTCQNPKVILKNTGSDALTSVSIYVWIGGFDNVIEFPWTGNLEFLEQEVVEIPITDDWWFDFQGKFTFSALVWEPNGVQDQYPNNDKYTVEFDAPPVYNEEFYFWYKTNNKAHENDVYLKDESGNIIWERLSADHTNSTEYKDTFNLAQGCYTLEMYDSDHDGLGYWYSNIPTSQGGEGETNGFFRIKQTNGVTLENFDRDFGRYFSHSFSVGFALGNEEQKITSKIDVFPNPTEGMVNLLLDNFKGDQINLSVYNEMGALVYTELIGDNNAEGYWNKEMNLSHLAEGIYFLKVTSDQETLTKRIVIQ